MTDQNDDPWPSKATEPAWKVGLADRLAEQVIWQTLFAQDPDDLDDIDTVEVWGEVIDRMEDAIARIWARWDSSR